MRLDPAIFNFSWFTSCTVIFPCIVLGSSSNIWVLNIKMPAPLSIRIFNGFEKLKKLTGLT